MYEIYDFSEWNVMDEMSTAGSSEKEWISNPENSEIALFKKKKDIYTTEHISEKIASDIAKIIGIECASIELISRDNDIGLASFTVLNRDNDVSLANFTVFKDKPERLVEGHIYISAKYPGYNKETLEIINTDDTKYYYSLDMIFESLEELGFEKNIFEMIIFDYIIGNTDRHPGNWAVIENVYNEKRFSPLYDNASSLFAFTNDSDIYEKCNDKNWKDAQIFRKSKSIIRIDKLKKKKPEHKDVILYLHKKYLSDTSGFIMHIIEKMDDKTIDVIINKFSNVLSSNKCGLIKEALRSRIVFLKNTYNRRD